MWYPIKSNMEQLQIKPVISKQKYTLSTFNLNTYCVKNYPDCSVNCLLYLNNFTPDIVQFLLSDCICFGFLLNKNAYWGCINYIFNNNLYTIRFEMQLLDKRSQLQSNIISLYNITISSIATNAATLKKLKLPKSQSKNDQPTNIIYKLFRTDFCNNVDIINESCF